MQNLMDNDVVAKLAVRATGDPDWDSSPPGKISSPRPRRAGRWWRRWLRWGIWPATPLDDMQRSVWPRWDERL